MLVLMLMLMLMSHTSVDLFVLSFVLPCAYAYVASENQALLKPTTYTSRTVTKALIGGGGGAYSYIRVLPDEFLLKSTVMTTDFKKNSSGRTRIYEYPHPPPPQLTKLTLKGPFI